MVKLPTEEIQTLLKEVVTHFDKEDVAVRERQIRTWRRLKLFWENFQRAWYSEVAHDWRIYDNDNSDDTDQSYYDKPVNVFRAYLESIMAALSVVVPPIKCYPDNADNTLDLSTARAGDKIAQLLYRHNDVSLLWLHALFIYCTEGLVACYTYPDENESYGTYEDKEYEDKTEKHQLVTCPNCGYQISDNVIPSETNPNNPEGQIDPRAKQIEEDKQDEFQPYNEQEDTCPACTQLITPQVNNEDFVVTRLVGVTTKAKTRICMECYGGLYIKVPNYARKQADCPYLIFAYETHYANAIEKYAHLHGKNSLTAKKIKQSTGPKDPYEQWGRLSPQYQGEYPQNTVTIRSSWLRPCAFNVLDEDKAKRLKDLYPKGVKVVLVNDEFGEACQEVLDDCWTLTYNPLSDYIHFDPLGLLLVSIQEITNDLISLTLQTIEHGIGQTFADPGVLNFNAYRQMEAVPGGVYEAVPKTGKSLQDGFFETRTASLSPEVQPFGVSIQNFGQLVSGALPSLFGGAMAGSETASQYSMSRAQALQRLQNVWKILTSWWKNIFGKAIPAYIQEIKEDEHDVQKDVNGNFINVFIRKAELEGKIGKVELEANENLPMTWSQIKDTIMQLLEINNPEVLAILGSPENLTIIREAIGLTDFFVPGEDDKDKQNDEIKTLVNTEPIPTGDMQMPEMPSVEIDPDYDNHEIHFETVRKWVISESGRQCKIDNEAGYRNVLLHGKMHLQLIQASIPQQPQGEGPPPEKPKANIQTPITGEQNVSTIQ